MRFFKVLFGPKEVRAALGVLDEAEYAFCGVDSFRSAAFDPVKQHVQRLVLARPSEFAAVIRKGTSPREYVYSAIANRAGDLLESGDYHIRRGHLNPVGPAEDLYTLFCKALDELVRIGAMDAAFLGRLRFAPPQPKSSRAETLRRREQPDGIVFSTPRPRVSARYRTPFSGWTYAGFVENAC